MAVAHRIYAQSLFEAAKERNALDQVREQFDDLTGAVAESPELAELLRNPQIDRRAKRDVLEAALARAETDAAFRNFVGLVAEKGRIGELADIHEEWQRLLAAEARVLELDLTTAIELSEEEAGEIVAQIEQAAGRRVEATRRVDPDLIGGLILQAGSVRVDGSVRGRLETLRQDLLARA